MNITKDDGITVVTGTRAELAKEATDLAVAMLQNRCALNWELAQEAAALAQYAETIHFKAAGVTTVAGYRFVIEET